MSFAALVSHVGRRGYIVLYVEVYDPFNPAVIRGQVWCDFVDLDFCLYRGDCKCYIDYVGALLHYGYSVEVHVRVND